MPELPHVTHHPDGTMSYRITKLRVKLLASDLPDYQIAALAGIHPYTLSLYAQGKKSPKIEHLNSLAFVFSCPTDEILGYEDYVLQSDSQTVRQSDLT